MTPVLEVKKYAVLVKNLSILKVPANWTLWPVVMGLMLTKTGKM